MASLLAATLMLSTVGCEKKAENIIAISSPIISGVIISCFLWNQPFPPPGHWAGMSLSN